jgi:hypothetical protein
MCVTHWKRKSSCFVRGCVHLHQLFISLPDGHILAFFSSSFFLFRCKGMLLLCGALFLCLPLIRNEESSCHSALVIPPSFYIYILSVFSWIFFFSAVTFNHLLFLLLVYIHLCICIYIHIIFLNPLYVSLWCLV